LQEGSKNVFDNQGRLDTRFGKSRFNSTSLGAAPLSCSYFVDEDGSGHLIAKVGAVIYDVQESGAHTALVSGLTATTKHRGLSFGNRHIISVEEDGFYQYDGTTFTRFSQAAPVGFTVALVNGQGSLSDGSWKVALTYYSSTTGFETNATESAAVVTSTPNSRVAIASIDATLDNATIDKVRVYASIDDGDFFLAEEIDIATTYNLDDDPDSSLTPPTTNASPIAGGGKFMVEYNGRLVYSGNSNFPNDIFFSEQFIPEAFDDTGTGTTLFASGEGNVTGLAVGFFNDSNLEPYLAIFKRKSIMIYSKIGDNERIATIEKGIGCVSDETISVRNGSIYFLSDSGWRVIYNGVLLRDQENEITLGLGDIDDIFKRDGFDLEITKSVLANFFSVYYSDLDQYITFVADSGQTQIKKAYVFNFATPGFYYYEFTEAMTCATIGQDDDSQDVVFMGDSSGYFYTHSRTEDKNDETTAGIPQTIDARARIAWLDGLDMAVSYNFRDILLRALNSDDTIDAYAYTDYNISKETSYSFDFSVEGFRLDINRLDIDKLGDERQIVTSSGDINRSGENIAIEFRQKADNANMGLIAMQIDFSPNGNRN
jgi:hypothetical protein